MSRRRDLLARADEIIRWIDEGAADGFILGFPVIAQGLDDFVDFVVPILEARGVYSRTLAGKTLRENLGLPFRESRYASGEAPHRALNRAAASVK